MKIRTLKIIGLAGVLALCLLLTGCYQPPDEVNNGQPTGAVTTSFFNTLAPTATVEVTPDTIAIDIVNHTIELKVSDEELEARRAKWVCPEPKIKTGYLARYAKLVSSADKGAILE